MRGEDRVWHPALRVNPSPAGAGMQLWETEAGQTHDGFVQPWLLPMPNIEA